MIQQYSQLDTGGMVRTAQMLSRMSTPWSTNMMSGAPSGETFWSIPAISQGWQLLIQWLLVRVLPPTTAVNYWILLGWILSGFAIYLLSRQLGVSRSLSMAGGIAFEMLPWIREQVNTHTSYVFVCMPLFVIYFVLKWFKNQTSNNLVVALISLVAAVFFDLYWLYFSVLIVILISLFHFKDLLSLISRLPSKTKYILISCLTITLLSALIIVQLITQQMSISVSAFRPLAVVDKGFIDEFNGDIWRYIRPDYLHPIISYPIPRTGTREDVVTYAGIVVVGLAIFAMSFALLQKRRDVSVITFLTVFFMLLTMPTEWKTPFGTFPGLVQYVRYIMPGVRVFSRAGLIVESLFCVLAVFGLFHLKKLIRSHIIGTAFVSVLLILICIDLAPANRRYINTDAVSYNTINLALEQFKNPVVVELPPDLNDQYFPVHYVDAPKFATLRQSDWNERLMLAATDGASSFAAYLKEVGITHIVVPLDQDGNPNLRYKWGQRATIDISLNDPRFVESARSGGKNPAALFEVHAQQGDIYCRECIPYRLHWSGSRSGFYTFTSDGLSVFYEDGADLSWAYPNDTPTIQIISKKSGQHEYVMRVHFVAAFGPNAPPQVLSIRSDGRVTPVILKAGEGTIVDINVRSNQNVSIQRVLPCTAVSKIDPGNSDPRVLCYGITSVEVFQK